jgi:two-component system, NtrC family, nitrogen regulation sensor histidine kinase NtrY
VFPMQRYRVIAATMSSDSTAVPDSRTRLKRQIDALWRTGRLPLYIEIGTLIAALLIASASYFLVIGRGMPQQFLTPLAVAGLLVANLLPVMLLLVLIARRIAMGRAAQSLGGGRGRLHVRLVALFSVIASVPTLLVVIFASLLFQYGVEFWFSDRVKTVLVNADRVAQAYVQEHKERILGEIVPMSGDLRNALEEASIDDPRFSEFFARQVAYRVLSEAAILSVGNDGQLRLIGGANLDKRPISLRLPPDLITLLNDGQPRVAVNARDRVEAAMLLDKDARLYLYVSRRVDPDVLSQVARARTALSDYNAMVERSRVLQLRFNAALILISLLIVAAVIWIALKLADRLADPLGELVDAARRVAGGDFSARVPVPKQQDEISTLANTFNRMTRRLEEQNRALTTANSQLDSRRALTEAVLAGVSAGVISIDRHRHITLTNMSARAMLGMREEISGKALAEVAPELDELLDGGSTMAVIQLAGAGDPRTLAVTTARTRNGHVLTFDDITQQLIDQRRAAWADVARRIAHEIKNPLTPIQLAAERLQRRYGRDISGDDGTFEKLTGTIVRQVTDLRRMVDEFSSFARMPKPVFRDESLTDIVRQALFLHEVAHPEIRFSFSGPDQPVRLPCDRRQLGQAFTNILKNAVEAVHEKAGNENSEAISSTIDILLDQQDGRISVQVADSGIGLPAERERLTEPYMTTRARGTGLGLAIVNNIMEEHRASMSFADRPGGGTIVTIVFDPSALPADIIEATEEPVAQEQGRG